MDFSIHSIKTVHIVAEAGGWCVLVTEAGETTRHSFELESFAVAFATGQRIRLGLAVPPYVSDAAGAQSLTA